MYRSKYKNHHTLWVDWDPSDLSLGNQSWLGRLHLGTGKSPENFGGSGTAKCPDFSKIKVLEVWVNQFCVLWYFYDGVTQGAWQQNGLAPSGTSWQEDWLWQGNDRDELKSRRISGSICYIPYNMPYNPWITNTMCTFPSQPWRWQVVQMIDAMKVTLKKEQDERTRFPSQLPRQWADDQETEDKKKEYCKQQFDSHLDCWFECIMPLQFRPYRGAFCLNAGVLMSGSLCRLQSLFDFRNGPKNAQEVAYCFWLVFMRGSDDKKRSLLLQAPRLSGCSFADFCWLFSWLWALFRSRTRRQTLTVPKMHWRWCKQRSRWALGEICASVSVTGSQELKDGLDKLDQDVAEATEQRKKEHEELGITGNWWFSKGNSCWYLRWSEVWGGHGQQQAGAKPVEGGQGKNDAVVAPRRSNNETFSWEVFVRNQVIWETIWLRFSSYPKLAVVCPSWQCNAQFRTWLVGGTGTEVLCFFFCRGKVSAWLLGSHRRECVRFLSREGQSRCCVTLHKRSLSKASRWKAR